MASVTKLNPKVSVITPVYNREKYIAKAINSVINQAYINWEYILVDDGSTDLSQNVIVEFERKDSRIKLYVRDREPKGAATCRNIGIEKSNGDYIIFLDSDDYLLAHCLSTRQNKIMAYPELDFLVFQMLVINEINQSKVLWNIHTDDSDLRRFLSFDFVWSVTSPVWKKESLIKLGGFDESLSCWQDIDLSLRAILNGLTYKKMLFHLPPDCVNVIHVHESISQKGSHSEKHIKSKIKVISNLFKHLAQSKKEELLSIPASHIGLEYYRKLYFKKGSVYLSEYVSKEVIRKKKFYQLLFAGFLMKIRLYYRLKKYLAKYPLFYSFFIEEWSYPTNFRRVKAVDNGKDC